MRTIKTIDGQIFYIQIIGLGLKTRLHLGSPQVNFWQQKKYSKNHF